jgi:hypothetical protein
MRARSRALFVFAIACSGPPKPPPAAAPVPVENVTRTCTEAAVGLQGGTKSIRPPDSSIVQDMRGLCHNDRWSAEAIECFATMREGDLGRCAAKLPDDARKAMFAALGGSDETAIALARIRLEGMHVGVPECDQLFSTVHDLMTCTRIPPTTRAMLGNSAADLWDLPAKIPPDAAAKMSNVCKQTLDEIQREAIDAGC